MLPESTTTMGDSVFVTTPKPFHIASAVAITVAKLSAVNSCQSWPWASCRASKSTSARLTLHQEMPLPGSAPLLRASRRTTPSLRIVASSAENIVDVDAS